MDLSNIKYITAYIIALLFIVLICEQIDFLFFSTFLSNFCTSLRLQAQPNIFPVTAHRFKTCHPFIDDDKMILS